MKLSNQALTCIMLALQKSIMEQSDIVPVLKGFDLELEGDELVVKTSEAIPKPFTFLNPNESENKHGSGE